MSADNGVYILKTTAADTDGAEYRVAHTQAIENIYWEYDDGNPHYVVFMFGKSRVFISQEDANKYAQELANRILADDFCPILEYGIVNLELPHPFNYYEEKNKEQKRKANKT